MRPSKGSAKPRAAKNKTKRNPRPSASSEAPPGYQPPRHETPPKSRITPPSLHRERVLPLIDVGSRKFEELCDDIIGIAFPRLVRNSLKRVSGVEQFGVDVEGFDDQGDTAVVISAKCYDVVKAWDFRPWIQDFLDHIDDHWKDKGVKDFVLAVTHECNDDDMNASAKALVKVLATRGIQFHLWNKKFISELLAKDVRLVDRYFGRYWVEAISAAVTTSSPTVEAAAPLAPAPDLIGAASILQRAIDEAVAAVRIQLQTAMDARLEEALKDLRRGRSQDFSAWLSEVQQDHAQWHALDPNLRAKALRANSMLHLQAHQVERARALLTEADAIAAAPDASARALLVRAESGVNEALALLPEPRTVRERELKAGLLVESGRAPEALTALTSVPAGEATAEVLRLRAIARFLSNDPEKAIRDAMSAVERAPDEAIPLLTLGSIRLFAALADGVEPQFGDMPQPINSALVKPTATARGLLDKALSNFEHLLTSVEQPLKSQVEIWKLAALLLHPDHREEAATFAQVLLRRPDPEPLAVAWAANFGVLRKAGRIKKVLGDAVRQRRGTPTHLVVLALLSAGQSHPARGLEVVKRYAHLYPHAEEFLQSWQAQFGDPSAMGGDGYSSAVHLSMREGTNEPLLALLSAPEAPVEQVISGAEFLAWRSAWADLDHLRRRLVVIGTERAVELAAVAALRSGRPEDCLMILKDCATAFDEGRLPTRLVYLRIKANEILGAHQPVIADLLALRSEGRDPHISHRLMHAYLRIGKLDEFRAEAETALKAGRLNSEEALSVAYALRAHAPATARRVLLHLSQQPISAEIAAGVLSIAAELGVSELQDRMLRFIATSDSGVDEVFIKLDSVEAALAFIDERSREYREAFAEWLRGQAPAALAMRSDLKSYGLLFLAEAAHRKNQIGDLFPMLLLSGTSRGPAPDIPEGRPPLMMDLSALLIATRLDILDALEDAFALQVPGSVADALLELAATFRSIDSELARACHDVLTPGASAVQIVNSVPPEALPIERTDEPGSLDAGVVRWLLDEAYRGGHLGRDQVERAIRMLDGQSASAASGGTSAALSPYALGNLARKGILEPIARAVPVFLAQADAERFDRQLDEAVHECALREQVSSLLAKTADRLACNSWRTMPRTPEADDEKTLRLPPHLRCVVETLEAQRLARGLFWIEDRALSHNRLDGALHLLDVIKHLRERSVISEERGERLLQKLREVGYAFMPLALDTVVLKIEAAAVDNGGLIETPDLADLRAWFAQEVGRLGYVDAAAQPAENGPIAGEVRRFLDLISCARDLLSRIWINRTATLEEKQARANWAWTCLRLEQAPTLPVWGNSDASGYHVALTIAHTLDIPLLSSLNSDEFGTEEWRDFVDWFVSNVLRPKAKADPKLGDAVTDILASMLDRLLERTSDLNNPDMERALAATLAKVAGEFLDLLPREWSERIEARHDLTERLQRRTTMMLVPSEGAETPLQGMAQAYGLGLEETARTGQPATVPLDLGDGQKAQVEVAAAGQEPARAIIVAGGRRTALNLITRTLLLPTEDTRARALRSFQLLLDPRGVVRGEDLDAVAAIPDAENRFLAFDDLIAGDFHHTVVELGQRFSKRRTLSVRDIELPSPKALAAFLRLDDLESLSAADIANAASKLRRELDLEETVRRIAGVPTDLPTDLLREFGVALQQRGEWSPPSESPLFALVRLCALVSTDAAEGALGEAVQKLALALKYQGELLVALVRHGALQALRREDWAELEGNARVALLWVYADQMTQALAAPGLDASRLARWIKSVSVRDFTDRQAEAATAPWVVYVTTDLDAELLSTAMLAVAIRHGVTMRLRDEDKQILMEIGQKSEGAWTPFIDVVGPPPVAPHDLWIAADPLASMVEAGWIQADHPFAAREHTELARRLIDQGIDPAQPYLLPALLSIVDMRRVNAEFLPTVEETLDRAAGEMALEPELGGVHRILSVRAIVLARRDEIDTFHAALRGQAARCSRKWPNTRLQLDHGGPAVSALALLLDTAFTHAHNLPRCEADRMAVFADGVRAIVDAWPNSLVAAIGKLDALVRHINVDFAAALWPALLDLRGRHRS
ncbi:hypothetical protein [Microvirga pudoricolor]|uniref:hypothetical protein n=1 Tax=Microvirga pudoricolor TaxID=2778729 RepID=UPI0019528F4D|nr:hypothetical protein [Microvirga pudoricolor]MBM6595338.1 hypothetical protein [Microvirga pudoricolor]